jgi:hypothetical protein
MIRFSEVTAFQVYANAARVKAPTASIWISRGLEKQWEIVDFVARRLVALGRIKRKDYESMTRLFHGYKPPAGDWPS